MEEIDNINSDEYTRNFLVLSSPHKFLPRQRPQSQVRCQANITIPACLATALPPGRRKDPSWSYIRTRLQLGSIHPLLRRATKLQSQLRPGNLSSAKNSKSQKIYESRPTFRFTFSTSPSLCGHGCQYRLPGTKSRRYRHPGQALPLGLTWG